MDPIPQFAAAPGLAPTLVSTGVMETVSLGASARRNGGVPNGSQTGSWDRLGPGTDWVLGQTGSWDRLGPGTDWVLGHCGPGTAVVLGQLWSWDSCGPGTAVVLGQPWSWDSSGPGTALVLGQRWSKDTFGRWQEVDDKTASDGSSAIGASMDWLT
ncbi:hypothetical protein QQX98_011775 [Neonectria punicea]|uniref:Uncharacterized protein n=1 Tax=Neonectria punicea TaxID=979145 RepID=A0ABR1GKV4_9HYPO